MPALAVLPLLDALRAYSLDPDLHDLLDLRDTERSWTLLLSSSDVQLWLISWPPGSQTGWHDHGTASGAFQVLRGTLTEHHWTDGEQVLDLDTGGVRVFAAGHVHDVRNEGEEPALSLHAYAPRLETMTRYALHDGRLVLQGVERAGEEW